MKDYKKGSKFLKNKDGEYDWFFNWSGGGFNTVLAKTKAQAIKKAKIDGYPSYMPDNQYARERSLRDVQDKFGKAASAHIIKDVSTNGIWSNKDQKSYYPKLKLTDVGFSDGLVPNESTFRKQTAEDSRETTEMGNRMTMASGGSVDDYINDTLNHHQKEIEAMKQKYRGEYYDTDNEGFLPIGENGQRMTENGNDIDWEFGYKPFSKSDLMKMVEKYPNATYIDFSTRLNALEEEYDDNTDKMKNVSGYPLEYANASFEVSKLKKYAKGGSMASGGGVDNKGMAWHVTGSVTNQDGDTFYINDKFKGSDFKDEDDAVEKSITIFERSGSGNVTESDLGADYIDLRYSKGGSMASGGKRKAKFKVNDMVYSYQNPNDKMRVSFVEDRGIEDGVDYGFGYKVALKTDEDGNYNPKGKYSQSSKWMHENSVSKTKKEKYEQGGSMASGGEMKWWTVELKMPNGEIVYEDVIAEDKDDAEYYGELTDSADEGGKVLNVKFKGIETYAGGGEIKDALYGVINSMTLEQMKPHAVNIINYSEDNNLNRAANEVAYGSASESDMIALKRAANEYMGKNNSYAKGGSMASGGEVYALVDNFDEKKQDYDQVYYKTDDYNEIIGYIADLKNEGEYFYDNMQLIEVKTNGKMRKFDSSMLSKGGSMASGGGVGLATVKDTKDHLGVEGDAWEMLSEEEKLELRRATYKHGMYGRASKKTDSQDKKYPTSQYFKGELSFLNW